MMVKEKVGKLKRTNFAKLTIIVYSILIENIKNVCKEP